MNFENPHSNPKELASQEKEVVPSLDKKVVTSIDVQSERLDRKIQEQSRTHIELRERLGYKREQFEHGKLNIDFLGVAHEPETLLRRRKEIEEAIRQADFVVLEALHTIGGDVHGKNPGDISVQQLSVEELADIGIEKRGSVIFFGEIQNIARKYGKPIVALDPFVSVKALLESNGKNFDPALRAADIEISKDHLKTAALGFTPAAGLAVFEKLRPVLKGLTQNDEDEHPEQPQLSRRTFLKRSVQAASVVMGGKSLLNTLPSQHILPKSLSHNLQDYRDVIVSTGLDILERKSSRKNRVAVIYGANHLNSVRTYLNDQSIREEKRKGYATFDTIAKPEIRAYSWQEEIKGNPGFWKEKLRQSF